MGAGQASGGSDDDRDKARGPGETPSSDAPPRHSTAPPPERVSMIRYPSEAPSSGVARRPRVLVADSDPRVRALLLPALGRVSSDVVEASSGSELELLLDSHGPFDLVVANLPYLPAAEGGYDDD